jgi:hypothetical protein
MAYKHEVDVVQIVYREYGCEVDAPFANRKFIHMCCWINVTQWSRDILSFNINYSAWRKSIYIEHFVSTTWRLHQGIYCSAQFQYSKNDDRL